MLRSRRPPLTLRKRGQRGLKPCAPASCAVRGSESRSIHPLRRHPQPVQCTQHPHFAPGEFVGPRAFFGEGHSVGARGVEHELCGDARDARQCVVGPHERAAAPPQQCAVGAFNDVPVFVDDDGFAGAEWLHGRAQRLQGLEVGAFHEGLRAHVVWRRGEHDF